MSDKNLWFGFLDAGKKSTAVLIDDRLSTGTPKTVYVFNLARGQILEYDRAIIESKLRELTAEEKGHMEQLKGAYGKALQEFRPRGVGLNKLLEAQPAKRAPARTEEATEEFGFEENEEAEWSEGEAEEEDEEEIEE
jgi:ribosomal protein L10